MKNKNKLCKDCKYFESFFEMYDCDPYEPKDCGRCLHPKKDNENETHWNTAGTPESYACEDFEE